MANVVLEFIENRKQKGKIIGFDRKKAHFVLDDSKIKPKIGEVWECFVWAKSDKYNLVKPFKRIDKKEFEEARKRVDEFNQELIKLERYVKDEDFDKIVFDDNNKPYLLSTKSPKYLREEYESFIIKKTEKGMWIRPILNPEDRKEWQMMPK